jgi:hypothetical protein
MIEISGDIWDLKFTPRVITTNGTVTAAGKAVMGRGVALDAKKKYPELSKKLAIRINNYGNIVQYFSYYKLFTFPVKHNWWEKADLKLIEKSTNDLLSFVNAFTRQEVPGFEKIYMVRPGCENGKRDWETEVKPILTKILDDRFIIVHKYR